MTEEQYFRSKYIRLPLVKEQTVMGIMPKIQNINSGSNGICHSSVTVLSIKWITKTYDKN